MRWPRSHIWPSGMRCDWAYTKTPGTRYLGDIVHFPLATVTEMNSGIRPRSVRR